MAKVELKGFKASRPNAHGAEKLYLRTRLSFVALCLGAAQPSGQREQEVTPDRRMRGRAIDDRDRLKAGDLEA